MLVKLTPGNQLALPTQALEVLGYPTFVDVSIEGDRLILSRTSELTLVQDHFATLGLTEQDVLDAVEWARTTA